VPLAMPTRRLRISIDSSRRCDFQPDVNPRPSAGIIAEHSLNVRLQMRASGATKKVVTQTKQTKIGPCEQVRVN
jgi:hypothetical protein